VNAWGLSSVGLIYTRGQVTSDTSPASKSRSVRSGSAIDTALVGQDTKPHLSERAGHVAVFRAGTDGGATLTSQLQHFGASPAQGCQQFLV